MNIFELNSVKQVIESYIDEQNRVGLKVTLTEIAGVIRVQKSYLSRQLSGSATFTQDHGYLLAQYLKLNENEQEFLFLLIDRDRSGVSELRDQIDAKINALRNISTRSENYIDKEVAVIDSQKLQQYYLVPEYQLVHLSFALPKFQANPDLVKEIFGISNELYSNILKILDELSLIKITKNSVQLVKSNLHLPKDSIYFHSWQLQMRLKAIEYSKKVDQKDKYNFLVNFTATDEDREKIRLDFMKFLKKVEATVKKADSKNLYQMSFDLFKFV